MKYYLQIIILDLIRKIILFFLVILSLRTLAIDLTEEAMQARQISRNVDFTQLFDNASIQFFFLFCIFLQSGYKCYLKAYKLHKASRQKQCQRIPKRQSKIDNPEKLSTQGTQDEDKQSKNTIPRGFFCVPPPELLWLPSNTFFSHDTKNMFGANKIKHF